MSRRPLLVVPWAPMFFLGALLTACNERPDLFIPVHPEFQVQGFCDQGVIGDIYNPCVIEISGMVVVHRRNPWDQIQWPSGKACQEIPGGCFDGDSIIVMGGTRYYDYSGGQPTQGKGTENGWSSTAMAKGTQYQGAIDMAIREISHYDNNAICHPIIVELLSFLRYGNIWVGENSWLNGEWVREEVTSGTIYINTKPGFIWNPDGTWDARDLRRTLTEEGIHMWFDTDVGHSSGDPPEAQQAMEAARRSCGYYR